MKRFIFTLVCVIGLSSLMMSCKEDETSSSQEPSVIELSGATRGNIESGNQFAFDLFKTHSKIEKDNMHISPFSIYTTLLMSANILTDNDDRDIVLSLLCLEAGESSLFNANEYCREMLTQLPKIDRSTSCIFANSYWSESAYFLPQSLLSTLENYFSAEIINENPSGEEGKKKINDWVGKNTKGFLPDFLDKPLPDEDAVVNACYFNGTWKVPFLEENTSKMVFYNLDNTSKGVKMMSKEEYNNYYDDEDLQLVSLKYGNGNFEMVIILPRETDNFDDVIESLNYEKFCNIIREAKENTRNVELKLPKFESTYRKDMSATFRCMNKDFADASLFDDFRHAMKIEVDEKGTKIAAASAASGIIDSGRELMICNHPFIYLVRETTTGAVLYMGKVVKF